MRARPRAVRGAQKYGPRGLFSSETFGGLELPADIVRTLTVAGNNSLAKSTWGVYKTAMGHLSRCQEETGEDMGLPLGQGQVVAFVGWLLCRRGVHSEGGP